MPAISSFFGIVVYMYYFDNRRHSRPHIHAKYSGEEVVVAIPEGEVLEGRIPRNKMKLLSAWIEIHRDELMEDWNLAIKGEKIFTIAPLQ